MQKCNGNVKFRDKYVVEKIFKKTYCGQIQYWSNNNNCFIFKEWLNIIMQGKSRYSSKSIHTRLFMLKLVCSV